MTPKMIEGHTRILGKSQGYLGLPIRDVALPDNGGNCMISLWEPTPAEIAAIVAGASIQLCVLGTGHPPVIMQVSEVPTMAGGA